MGKFFHCGVVGVDFFRWLFESRRYPSSSPAKDIVKSLAVLCGGLDGDEEQIILGDSWAEEVRFKARGNESGFIPRGCFSNQDDVAFRVRFGLKLEDRRPEDRSEKMKETYVGGGSVDGDVELPICAFSFLKKVVMERSYQGQGC